MTKEELLVLLKENLTVEIFNPYGWDDSSSTTVKVQISFGEEVICSDYMEIRECKGHNR